jgi:hypothetical protein
VNADTDGIVILAQWFRRLVQRGLRETFAFENSFCLLSISSAVCGAAGPAEGIWSGIGWLILVFLLHSKSFPPREGRVAGLGFPI